MTCSLRMVTTAGRRAFGCERECMAQRTSPGSPRRAVRRSCAACLIRLPAAPWLEQVLSDVSRAVLPRKLSTPCNAKSYEGTGQKSVTPFHTCHHLVFCLFSIYVKGKARGIIFLLRPEIRQVPRAERGTPLPPPGPITKTHEDCCTFGCPRKKAESRRHGSRKIDDEVHRDGHRCVDKGAVPERARSPRQHPRNTPATMEPASRRWACRCASRRREPSGCR